MTGVDAVVVRRRRAIKDWTCAGEFAHDRHIRPGQFYCEVTMLPAENFSRDVAMVRYCDYCGRNEHPEYEELAAGATKAIEGQTAFAFFDEEEEPDGK